VKSYQRASSSAGPKIKNFFVPSLAAVCLYLLISFLVLGILNIRAVWDVLVGASVGSVRPEDVSFLIDNLLKLQDKLNGVFLFFFWGVLGGLVYSAVWLFQNAFLLTDKQVKGAHYLRGGYGPEKRYWHSVLAGNLYLLAAVISWLGCIFLYIQSILPFCSKLFQDSLYKSSYQAICGIILAVIIQALTFYCFLRIQRALVYSWRINRPSV
jgi:hypothetical protein